MTDFLTVRGGCPLGWETEIFDISSKIVRCQWLSLLVIFYGNIVSLY
jgi:hypothetical protein